MLGALVVLAHCGGDDLTLPRTAVPASITKIGGANLTGSAGAPLGEPLIVKVVDRDGAPVANQGVAFDIDPGATGAQVTPAETNTNPDGLAQADWVLGAPSGTQVVTARVIGADDIPSVTFEASVQPAAARRLARLGGHDQSGAVGTELSDPLVVLVTDEFGNPVPDVAVEWSTGNGSVDPGSSTTNSDGQAATTWTLGSSTGPQAATATNPDLEGSPVEFAATAVAGRATRLELVSGDNQTAAPGQLLPQPLVVRLLDDDGNRVPNRAVSWVVGVGGGSVESLTSNTNENGEAQTRWTLGPSPGLNTLNAVVSGVDVVGFRATASGSGGGGGFLPQAARAVARHSEMVSSRARD